MAAVSYCEDSRNMGQLEWGSFRKALLGDEKCVARTTLKGTYLWSRVVNWNKNSTLFKERCKVPTLCNM